MWAVGRPRAQMRPDRVHPGERLPRQGSISDRQVMAADANGPLGARRAGSVRPVAEVTLDNRLAAGR